ncbi:MAG: prepilin-type N-terminal cleavage/methylation domain-containing protein [Desulfobacterales bacterium]|nr:prepilin-type N-terminal cleavage/methylation domain-containing protein [Desulfobacterales bacterium]
MERKVKSMAVSSRGFTLVELLIGIAISSVVVAAAYSVFSSQQKAYTVQQGVVDIQENLRAGLYYLTREIRLAGYNRLEFSTKEAVGIIEAGSGKVRFTMDIYDGVDDDGDGMVVNDVDEIGFCDKALNSPGEDITYALAGDAAGDGVPDMVAAGGTPQPTVLQRNDTLAGGGPDTLVENVEAIAFAYAFDDNDDGRLDFVDTNGNGIQDAGEPTIWAIDTDNDRWLDTSLDTNADGVIDVNDAPGGVALAIADRVPIGQIRAVQIWMLVRSPSRDESLVDQSTYVIGDKRLVANDNFRRRLLTASVVCRNMGG